MNGTMIANLVSGLFCISKDNCRSRKKVLIDRRARSTSPQGSRLVKSIPVKGVTFCCQTRKKKNISPFPHFKDYDAETQWSRIQKNPLFNISIFYGFQWDSNQNLPFYTFFKKKVVGSNPNLIIFCAPKKSCRFESRYGKVGIQTRDLPVPHNQLIFVLEM